MVRHAGKARVSIGSLGDDPRSNAAPALTRGLGLTHAPNQGVG